MPITIDKFHVTTYAPIDSRFVVGGSDSFYQQKEDIEFLYEGLRIWDLNDDIPYCWKGTVEGWVSENSVGVSADSTADVNYIPLFTTGPTVIGKSIIYQNPASNQVGIGLVGAAIEANIPSGPSLVNGLHVAGNIRTNNYFVGSGLHVTDINATNINSGLLSIARISHLSDTGSSLSGGNYVLTNFGVGSSVTWSLASGLSVLNSTNTTNITISEDQTSTNSYITFVNAISGQLPLKINSSKMQFRTTNGQLFLSDGDASEPTYTFLSSRNNGIGKSGMYYSVSNGVSTSILGTEITSVRTYGLVTNNRIYIPGTSNNTDVGYGIVWLANGPSNDININDGFVYNGQRLNFYGLGSHIPDNSNTLSTLAGRGTYIAGYFGVDIFSGGRLKVKVDEYNDINIFSRLNIIPTGINGDYDILGGSINENRVLLTIKSRGGSTGNNVVIKDWSVRANTGTDWLTWKHHNGITIDGYYNTPNGPAKPSTPGTVDSPTYGTLTFWERHPFLHEQYFGSENRKTLTINSSNPTTQNPFVKVDGNLLVGNGNLLVGTNTITSSAIADFTSTTKGFLPPRMTNVQKNAITSPVSGLTIYNTDKKSLDTYDGFFWMSNIKTKVIDIIWFKM